MTRFDSGSVTVPTSGTAVQVSTSIAANARIRANDLVLSIEIKPRSGNSGAAMYLGSSNVETTYGEQILKGDSHTVSLSPGGDKFSSFYVDADANGDIADWIVTF